VFGMDSDGPDVFARTVAWAVKEGLATAKSATSGIQHFWPIITHHRRTRKNGREAHWLCLLALS